MFSDALMKELMPQLGEAMAERIDALLGDAGREVLERAIREYLERHGAEVLAPVVKVERLKRKTLLTPEEVEIVYGFKRRTLEDWRLKKIGPEYEKPGGKVKYRVTTLDAFCRASRVLTSESPSYRAVS
jgi:hypothetical protein